jgi:hypothetical protein
LETKHPAVELRFEFVHRTLEVCPTSWGSVQFSFV